MHTTYFDEDDILASNEHITRKVSQNWNTYISYTKGSAVEVVLEARVSGSKYNTLVWPESADFSYLRWSGVKSPIVKSSRS